MRLRNPQKVIRKKLPNVSLATVYRNLETMHHLGMISKIETPDGQKRFDSNTLPHPHFHCGNCEKIEDVPLSLQAPMPDPSHEWVRARQITSSTLHYQGLCRECRMKV